MKNQESSSQTASQSPERGASRGTAQPADILHFWLKDWLENGWPSADIKTLKQLWFGGGRELNELITERFGEAVTRALGGSLEARESEPISRLALILLLDQFSRNVFRGSRKAFDGDARAQRLVLQTIASGEDNDLPIVGRVFLYMPLMHAESIALQDECVRQFDRLQNAAPAAIKPLLADQVDFTGQHRDIIAQFGRFPHRNEVLGRASTAEESTYLLTGKRFGQ